VIERQDRLLADFSLPTSVPKGQRMAADGLIEIMRRDKKSVAGSLRFVLPDRVGHVELVDGVPEDLVSRALSD
jgi:3-dehydroquinate synthase